MAETFKVYLFSTTDGTDKYDYDWEPIVREVSVNDAILAHCNNETDCLNAIYYRGQNDFDPQMKCSVSMGDVIRYKGRYFLVKAHGFEEMCENQFLRWHGIERRDRSFFPEAPKCLRPGCHLHG